MSFTNGYDGYDRFIIIFRVMLNAVNIPNHTFSEAGLRCRIYIYIYITLCVIVAVAVILHYMYLWLLRLFRFYF